MATGSGFSHLLHSMTAYGPPGQRSSDFREQQSKWGNRQPPAPESAGFGTGLLGPLIENHLSEEWDPLFIDMLFITQD